MRKKLDKKTKKIAAATAMSIFSLITVFTATFAWFAMNKKVGGSGLSIIAKEDGTGLSALKAYKCVLDKSRFNDLLFDGKSQYTSSGSSQSYSYQIQIEMLDYSTLSNMSPVLFLFDFSVQENSTLTFPTQAKDILLSGSTATTAVASEPATSLPLSNFISFKSGIISPSQVGTGSNMIVITDSEGIAEIKPSSILTQTTGFASYNSSGTTHDEKYPFTKNINVYEGASNDTTQVHYLAVVMDYNQDVISHWKDDYLGNFTGNRISFTCDFSLKI